MATAVRLPERNPLDQISYTDLYRRWEQGNWSAWEIDFAEDKRQWHEVLTETQRKAALWNYALFFHGEESVAENLSPYIDAAPTEEQKHFLCTQQVDEARHAIFFGRFMREVIECGETTAEQLAATEPELTWGFRNVFGRLDKMADELRKDRSVPKLAQAITLYHLIVEAALAQPGQHFIETYLTEHDVLPGFRSGMKNVSLDEQRHIGFGVKLLSELVASDPECRPAVEELLREVMPTSLGVLKPPNWDTSYVECFGFTLEDIYAEGFQSFQTKMRTAGLPIEEMPGVIPFPTDITPHERAARVLKLMRAGYLGEKDGPPSQDPEAMELFFDVVSRAVDHEKAPNGGPTTIEWDFTDAEPWHLVVDNGSTRVAQGRASAADLTLECRFEDWVDVVAAREDPRVAMLKRKIKPHGGLRAMLRTRKLFAR